jgi:hypothetical protein
MSLLLKLVCMSVDPCIGGLFESYFATPNIVKDLPMKYTDYLNYYAIYLKGENKELRETIQELQEELRMIEKKDL